MFWVRHKASGTYAQVLAAQEVRGVTMFLMVVRGRWCWEFANDFEFWGEASPILEAFTIYGEAAKDGH